jgi:hypothetical protein
LGPVMTKLWRAVGGWLRGHITFRRVVYAAAFAVAVIALGQFLTMDLALFMAGDVAFYCEILSAVMLIVVRGHIRHYAQMTKLALRQMMRRAHRHYRRGIGVRRRRGMRKPFSGGSDDGEGYPVFAMQAV